MAGADEATITVTAASRGLRRQLRPLAWVTLEEVALDAVTEGGRFVARTSARLVAERLGVAPAAAAGALRALSQRGLLVLQPDDAPDRRFDLSVYRLEPVAGLAVAGQWMPLVSPDMAAPDVDPLCSEDEGTPVRSLPPSSLSSSQGRSGSRPGDVVSGGVVASPEGWQVSVAVGLDCGGRVDGQSGDGWRTRDGGAVVVTGEGVGGGGRC